MLLVAKVRAGGHAYYLEPTGTCGRRAVEAPGRWVGRGASVLGLDGTVTPADLEAVLAGTEPHGAALPGAERGRVTVVAFDLTFCAPKSVSILHGLSEPDVSDAVAAGHGHAVTAGVAYLEDHALAVRRRSHDAPRVPVPAEGAPSAAFVHRTSRALDPHLHTHVVLANVGRDPDGSWSALDGRGVYAHATAAGAVYQAQLRHELTATLGVAWGPLRRAAADIAGIEVEARREFSRRSEQIAAHLAARGLGRDDGAPVSRRAARVAGLSTRPDRDLGVAVEELRPWWRDRARDVGLGPRRLGNVLDRVSGPAPSFDGRRRPGIADYDGAAVAGALAGVRDPGRSFSRRDVVRSWAGSLPEGAPAPEVAAVVDRFMDEVSRAAPGARWAADGRGVAEPRAEIPDHLRRRELELLLERRGITLERDARRGLGIDRGIGLG